MFGRFVSPTAEAMGHTSIDGCHAQAEGAGMFLNNRA